MEGKMKDRIKIFTFFKPNNPKEFKRGNCYKQIEAN